ncbi:SIR2 family protein [Blastococcus sp. SYSU D00922]
MSFNSSQDSYVALKEIIAERTAPILVWTGAGLSASAGLPVWVELRQKLIDAAYSKAATFDPREAASRAQRIDNVVSEPDPWVAFQRLRQTMGPASYESVIRRAMSQAVTCKVPATYRHIWRLNVAGILNLNIDRLATRAFSEERPGESFLEFEGTKLARLPGLLHGRQPFVANLHGTSEDTTSWIFTNEELSKLQKDKAYLALMQNCFSTFTNVFIGVSADDVAISRHLSKLKDLHLSHPPHFWLTHRTDAETDAWAEELGIQVIRYTKDASGHDGPVEEFFTPLLAATPAPERTAFPPVSLGLAADVDAEEEELAPSELRDWSAPALRKHLNARAAQILRNGDSEAWSNYEAFSKRYDEAIYRAWYTSDQEGSNDLLGYTLQEQIARGAFGRVYRAMSPAGETVAVKVLLEEIRRDLGLLQSFRRGVQAMRILGSNHLRGMVPYREASEIPAFVVMDWIDGPNLFQAKQSGYVDDWPTLLRIAQELVGIIAGAHALPDRILHRDLRPANIMLSGFYTQDDWHVVVLDFDLSWHRGANEKSVVYSTAMGYLAPEQVTQQSDASTRSAAVDAFGIGTTLNFLCSGVDPVLNEQQRADYPQRVAEGVATLTGVTWRSLPARFSRLILGATAERQADRWDLSQIAGELGRLRVAAENPQSVTSAELVAEELATAVRFFNGYVWESDTLTAKKTSPTGMSLSIAADEVNAIIALTIGWTRTGVEQRTGLSKFVKRNAQALTARLASAGWKIAHENVGSSDLNVRATISTSTASRRLSRLAASTETALESMQFGPAAL